MFLSEIGLGAGRVSQNITFDHKGGGGVNKIQKSKINTNYAWQKIKFMQTQYQPKSLFLVAKQLYETLMSVLLLLLLLLRNTFITMEIKMTRVTRDDKRWQEMTRDDKRWQKMTRDDKRWQEMTRDDKRWQEMTRDVNMCQRCQRCLDLSRDV